MEFLERHFIIILLGAALLGITILFFCYGHIGNAADKKYKLKCNNCGENEIFIFKLSELLFDFSDVLSIKCGHCGNTMCFDKSKLSAVSDEVKHKSGGIVILLCIGLLRVLQAGRESGDMDAALASIMIYALPWLAYAFYRYNSFKRTVLYKLYVEDDVSKFRFVGIDKSVK